MLIHVYDNRALITKAFSLVPLLPSELYGRIVSHVTDPHVAAKCASRALDNYRPLSHDEHELLQFAHLRGWQQQAQQAAAGAPVAL